MISLALNPAKPLQVRIREALLRELSPDGIRPEDYGFLPRALRLIEEYQDRQPEIRTYLIGGADDFCTLASDVLVNIGRGRALKVTVQGLEGKLPELRQGFP